MSRSASSSRMLGLFPPSSRVTFLMVPDASCMTRRPTSVEPVNEILSTRGSVTRASPAEAPGPGTMFATPGGSPASARISAMTMAVPGVSMAGFRTAVFPVIRAGASFHTTIRNGKFHGMMPAQTPNGSRRTKCHAGLGKWYASTGSS